MSKRRENWVMFAALVAEHIENYTVPQFGDAPNDQIEAWTAQDCVTAIRKYYKRFGTNMRGIQDQLRDMLKIAHFAQLAYDKLRAGSPRTNVSEKRTVWPERSERMQPVSAETPKRDLNVDIELIKKGLAVLLGEAWKSESLYLAQRKEGTFSYGLQKTKVDNIEALKDRLEGKI